LGTLHFTVGDLARGFEAAGFGFDAADPAGFGWSAEVALAG
jgi:hypothetical protein